MVAGSYGAYIFRLADGSVQQYISRFRTPRYCYYGYKLSLANNHLYIASGDSFLDAYSASNLWKFVVKANPIPLGSPVPHSYGTNYVIDGTLITNTVASPIAGSNGVQYVDRKSTRLNSSHIPLYRM